MNDGNAIKTIPEAGAQTRFLGGLFCRFIPARTERAIARLVLLHGYGDHSGRYLHLLNWLADRGIDCSTFDFRGHGRSAGSRAYVRRWEEFLDDAKGFLNWQQSYVSREIQDLPLFILGHSHGGLVAAAAGEAGFLNTSTINCAGCIMTCPYLRPKTPLSPIWSLIAKAADRVLPRVRVSNGLSQKQMSSDPAMRADSHHDPLLLRFATPRWYTQTLRVQREVLKDAPSFRQPLLCLVSGADPIADPRAAEEFFQRVGSADRTLRTYPDRLHELLRDVGREEVFQTIFDWIKARANITP